MKQFLEFGSSHGNNFLWMFKSTSAPQILAFPCGEWVPHCSVQHWVSVYVIKCCSGSEINCGLISQLPFCSYFMLHNLAWVVLSAGLRKLLPSSESFISSLSSAKAKSKLLYQNTNCLLTPVVFFSWSTLAYAYLKIDVLDRSFPKWSKLFLSYS